MRSINRLEATNETSLRRLSKLPVGPADLGRQKAGSMNTTKQSPAPFGVPAEEIYCNFEDHARFCKESLIVETEGRALVPMILSPGQVRLHEAMERQRQASKPVRIIYLKTTVPVAAPDPVAGATVAVNVTGWS
jgi:hypothetical protein